MKEEETDSAMHRSIPGKLKLQNAALPFLLTLVRSKTPLSYPWGNQNTVGGKKSHYLTRLLLKHLSALWLVYMVPY